MAQKFIINFNLFVCDILKLFPIRTKKTARYSGTYFIERRFNEKY